MNILYIMVDFLPIIPFSFFFFLNYSLLRKELSVILSASIFFTLWKYRVLQSSIYYLSVVYTIYIYAEATATVTDRRAAAANEKRFSHGVHNKCTHKYHLPGRPHVHNI